jgi:hypothetical protein
VAAGAAIPAHTDLKMESIDLIDIRGIWYCEFVLVFDDHVDIYNTSASQGCPDDKWQAMDTTSVATNHGAKKA